MKFTKLPLIILLLAASNVYADGVDDPTLYAEEHDSISRQDPNYWSNFDKNPCSYDLGYHESNCINPHSRIGYIPEVSLDHHNHNHTTQTVPEPAPLLLLGVAVSVLALIKKRVVKK